MKVIHAPDERLRVKTKPIKKITPGLLEVIRQMVKLTKTFIDPEGVGLASTQIGNTEQYFVAKFDGRKFTAVFNPKVLAYSKNTKVFFEGCLSIPDHYAEVTRPTSVEVSYLDEHGKQVHQKLKSTAAWIFQHEYDHLQGKLFIDLVLEQKSRLFKTVGKDRTGIDIFQEVLLRYGQ